MKKHEQTMGGRGVLVRKRGREGACLSSCSRGGLTCRAWTGRWKSCEAAVSTGTAGRLVTWPRGSISIEDLGLESPGCPRQALWRCAVNQFPCLGYLTVHTGRERFCAGSDGVRCVCFLFPISAGESTSAHCILPNI